MDKILLIDTASFAWRANYSFKMTHGKCTECSNVKHNQNTEHCVCGGIMLNDICLTESNLTIFNFFKNLRPIIELLQPEKCFFILERHPKFRYDLFPEYKKRRSVKFASAAKQDSKQKFYNSFNSIIDLIKYLPCTICKAKDYEGDDVIGTLSENLKNESLTILSNDSDYIQLLQRGYVDCEIYNPIKKEYMTAPKYPYIAFKSLVGDKSDDIPGLVSEAKAISFMKEPEKFKKFLSLEENRALFSINKKLIEFANISLDEIMIEDCVADFNSLKNHFIQMKFDSITNDISWNKFVKTFNCIKF